MKQTALVGALTFVGLACSPPALAASPQAEGFKKLSAVQIRQAFAGRRFSDDTHFAFDYRANGNIAGTSMGKAVRNKWTIAKDQLCITDRFGETCYVVWKKGASVKLIIEDSDASIEGTLR
jgi:hypothetical protein